MHWFFKSIFLNSILSCGGYGENVEEQAAVPSHAELESRKRDPLALRALQGPWRDEVLSDPFLWSFDVFGCFVMYFDVS